METPAVDLAGRAAELSTSLYGLGEHCKHEETASDIFNIAGELTLLSTTLWRLHEAMAVNSIAYTTAFNDDLGEITSELTLLFDEIDECCTAMQKSDMPSTTTVGWFFKKGRVHKLKQHLEALKTTLIVMRTVLHHGKEYGIQNSPSRLAESMPHTMVEDRAILESVFAKNRNAIMDLHKLEKDKCHDHSSSTSSTSMADKPATNAASVDENYLPGAHGRNLSNATGVEISPLPDVLPTKPVKSNKPAADNLSRRFSKRDVRLGVHMSILDLGAHDAAASLRNKWIAQARTGDHGRALMSTINEDSTKVKNIGRSLDHSDDSSTAAKRDVKTPTRSNSGEIGGGDGKEKKARIRANSLITSPMGKAVSKVIRRLSLSNVRAGHHGKETQSGGSSGEHSEEGGTSVDNGDHVGLARGLTNKLSLHLTRPELKTPDFNKEFENGNIRV